MRAQSSVAIMVIVGALFAVALFAATSEANQLAGHSGLICLNQTYVQEPGFDPLTGEPHGRTERCTDTGFGWTEPPDAELAARQAIPVPVGFLIGTAAAGAVLLVAARGRGSNGPSGDIHEH